MEGTHTPIKIASSTSCKKYKVSEYKSDSKAAIKSNLSVVVKFFNILI